MSERLTRQELSWLLTQEARGAAERLRKGVQILTKPAEPAPPPRSERAPGSERPVTLTSTGVGEDAEGLQSTLDMLDGAMQRLSELSGPSSQRGRRGRVDLAALLWEIAPDAKVQLTPGTGTEVFGEENELRRMLHVLVGSWTQSGVGGAQVITLKRDGEEVRLGVALGPDTAPISPAERGWLSRMAIRFGGRYELDGASECLVFPAEEAEQRHEMKELRKELEAAKAQGEAYARELAAVFAEEPDLSSRPPYPHENAVPSADALGASARIADALADDLRSVFAPLGAARLKAHRDDPLAGFAPLIDEVQAALTRGAELLAVVRQMARIGSDLAMIPVDLATVAQDESALATVAFASRGVVLTLAASDEPADLVIDGLPAALRALVAEMLDRALRCSKPGGEVRISIEGRALVIDVVEGEMNARSMRENGRAAFTFLQEIARVHGIRLDAAGRSLRAQLPPR